MDVLRACWRNNQQEEMLSCLLHKRPTVGALNCSLWGTGSYTSLIYFMIEILKHSPPKGLQKPVVLRVLSPGAPSQFLLFVESRVWVWEFCLRRDSRSHIVPCWLLTSLISLLVTLAPSACLVDWNGCGCRDFFFPVDKAYLSDEVGKCLEVSCSPYTWPNNLL